MKPRINLCIYNHAPHYTIRDQIWFISEVFSQQGYELICSKTLRTDCINLMIENFVEEDHGLCEAFCRKFNKQIGIIMTEHIELERAGFSFNGSPLEDTAYIGNKGQRLFGTLSLAECVFGFFTLGELPELRTWTDILPNQRVHRLPYPAIRSVARHPTRRDHDIVFTGTVTPHRESVLKDAAKKYKLARAEPESSERQRSELYAKAKIALNIPQTRSWKWVSPMRVLFGLRAGTPTVHIGLRDTTLFSKLVLEPVELDEAVAEHDALFQQQMTAYEGLVRSKYNHQFPDGLFGIWGDLERVH